MTEAEWLACEEPGAICAFLRPNGVPDRKVRLFAVACCRRLFHLPIDERNRSAVGVAELYADGRASLEDLREGRGTIGPSQLSAVLAHSASMMVWHAAEWAMKGATLVADEKAERGAQTAIARDVFGNPFRPVAFDAAWRTGTAVALANGMYESRDFVAMPILADALQDAGCTDEEVLGHCRDAQQPHARGCWVVDLVLGKE